MQITYKTRDPATRLWTEHIADVLPCPFCGVDGEQVLYLMIVCRVGWLDEETADGQMAVTCGNCGMVGPQGEKESEAIEAWNGRQPHKTNDTRAGSTRTE